MNKIATKFNNKLTIINACLKAGQLKKGVDCGPTILYKNGLNRIIKNYTVKKIDINKNFKNNNSEIVGDYCKNIALNAYQELHTDKPPFLLTIGGDHSIAIGSISGILKANPDIGILWIDAHPDIHTLYTSESKNIHGMVNGFLMRLFDINVLSEFSWLNEYPKLLPNRLAYIGLRSIDPAERKIINPKDKSTSLPTVFYSDMNDIHEHGIAKIVNNAIEFLGNRPIHLSFDIDAIDPIYAPSTGTACKDGLTKDNVFESLEIIKNKTDLISMDLVEINPFIGTSIDIKKTAKLGNDIIKFILTK